MIAPASTGRERSRRIVVTIRDQTKRGIRSAEQPFGRIFRVVVMKLMDPRIDEIPAR